MDTLLNHVVLSRLQFAFTAMFHILWPVLTIGLSLFLLLLEALWLKTHDQVYYRHARFWGRLFIVNFSVGVVTGIPMEFQFGTNWSAFSQAGGDVFGHLLGFEAAMSFMLEASFLAIMIFGWKRVSPGMHLFATAMVALGSSLSAFWIMVANSWMHTPTGGYIENGRFVLTSHYEAIFNPDMFWGVSHMWVACIEISLFVVGGVSAWYMLKDRHTEFFLKSFKIAVIGAIFFTPLQVWLGDGSGRSVFEYQPAKLGAMESHWHANPEGQGAPWHILAWPDELAQDNLWSIDIPMGLSLIATSSLTGKVKGLAEFPLEDQPPVWIPFYAFRIMIAIGMILVFVMFWTLWAWYRGHLSPERIAGQKRLLSAWLISLPLSYLAMEAGWATREVGRQPWVLYGKLRVAESATTMPAAAVGASLFIFSVIYSLLFVLFLIFARRIIVRGPDTEAPRTGA